ncbi:hypothetical protein LEP1GSC151_4785 [Leptospira interrogans serovar Grippotyphosa str. LT2186]|uniref:Uncharacterized protein n=1 Tax=Leptospira interrogans serovar Grippotyphosa str. LT2186 TaxID=1001599 RepID=M3FWQ1_LEPIR|nr:hypothetical protein LEP1GSC151_4785 [Leptospira interrogans serovar Grippotyphosa str. LT2186]
MYSIFVKLNLKMNLAIQLLKKNRILIFHITTSFIFLFSVYTYFYTIRKYSVNFPFGDDYNTILGFLDLWEKGHSKISIYFLNTMNID